MARSNKIAAIILGAAGGFALIKFLSMPKEERNDFYRYLKNKTSNEDYIFNSKFLPLF